MNVLLLDNIKLRFEVDKKFLKRHPFVKTSVDCDYFHSRLDGNLLMLGLDEILEHGILDGPNGVFPSLAERDGSFAGSVPHDVVWQYAKKLAKLWGVDVSKVRKFGDDIYVNTTFAYGGKTLWTRLANRFCYKVAFPFGNFLKKNHLKLPTYTAPLIVLALFPIALWMFLFNKSYCEMTAVDLSDINLELDSGETKRNLVLKPVSNKD